MLFLCALAISVKAQSPTQNYVLSKDVLDVDGTHAITTHSHQDKSLPYEPSFSGGSTNYGDAGLSMNHLKMPVFVMGHNKILYVIRGLNSPMQPKISWSDWGKNSLMSLLKGKIKLSKAIYQLRPLE